MDTCGGPIKFAYVFPINQRLHWSYETQLSLVRRCEGTEFSEDVTTFARTAGVGSFITLDGDAFIVRTE